LSSGAYIDCTDDDMLDLSENVDDFLFVPSVLLLVKSLNLTFQKAMRG